MERLAPQAGQQQRSAAGFQVALAVATLGPWLVMLTMPSVPLAFVVLLGSPHIATTLVFYLDPEARPVLASNRARFLLAPPALLAAGFLIGGVHAAESLAIVGLGVWQIHHFTRQNLGVFSFWCRARRDESPSELERRLIAATGYAGMLGAVRTLTVDVPFAGLLALAGAVVLVAVAVVTGWHVVAHRLTAGRAAALGMLVAFYAPLFISRFTLVQAVAAYGLAHGAQYLLMMGGLRGGRPITDQVIVVLGVTVLVLGLGVPLYYLSPMSSQLAFGVYFGVSASHFVVDAGAWKMRLPEPRAYMRRRFTFL